MKVSKLAERIVGALSRRGHFEYGLHGKTRSEALEIVDQRLSNIRQVVEPLSRGATDLYDYALIKKVQESLEIEEKK